MKHIIFVAALLLIHPAWAETIKADVSGLVCALCAKGIKKSFDRMDTVAEVLVDLDRGFVGIALKEGHVLSDRIVTETIIDSGYTVTGITRTDAALSSLSTK